MSERDHNWSLELIMKDPTEGQGFLPGHCQALNDPFQGYYDDYLLLEEPKK